MPLVLGGCGFLPFDHVRIESAESDMRTVVEDLGPREVVDGRSADRCYTTSMCKGDFQATIKDMTLFMRLTS